MLVNTATLLALRTAYQDNFQKALAETKSDWQQVATLVASQTSSNTYGWLGQWPGFREWIGDRVLKDMAAHSYTISNKTFESSVSVKRDDIEDDNVGVYSPLFTEMGRAASVFPDELVFPLIKDGASNLCYDGQNFFDTDHPVYANVDGTGAVTTVSNDGGGTGTAWYLVDNSRALKPFIYQQRRAPEFTFMDQLTDESVFMRNEFRYGTSIRCNVGYGFWQQAYRCALPLDSQNLNAAITAMMTLKTDGGRPINIRPTHILIPPSLRDKANEVIMAERLANGATNTNRHVVQIIMSPWLA